MYYEHTINDYLKEELSMALESIIALYQGTSVEAPIAKGLRSLSNELDCCDVDGNCCNCD